MDELSYPASHLVSDHIPAAYGAISCVKFDDILTTIRLTGRGAIIIKRDMESAFRNVPVAISDKWLLGLEWGHYYTENCLPFGLRTAPFLFNLFAEGFHWITQHRRQPHKMAECLPFEPPTAYVASLTADCPNYSANRIKMLWCRLTEEIRRGYDGAVRIYTQSCALDGRKAWPANEVTLAAFVERRGFGVDAVTQVLPSTIEGNNSAIQAYHVDRGWPTDSFGSDHVWGCLAKEAVWPANAASKRCYPATPRRYLDPICIIYHQGCSQHLGCSRSRGTSFLVCLRDIFWCVEWQVQFYCRKRLIVKGPAQSQHL